MPCNTNIEIGEFFPMWASLNDVKLGHNVVYYNFILCADIEYIYKKTLIKREPPVLKCGERELPYTLTSIMSPLFIEHLDIVTQDFKTNFSSVKLGRYYPCHP